MRYCSRTFLPLVAAAMLLPSVARGQAPATRQVADRYLELTMRQDYDSLLDLSAADAIFLDPTGEVFGGAMAAGAVQGAKAIVELQKSWGLQATEFDIETSFAVGEYALYRGTLSVRYAADDPWTAFPFITVLRVGSDRVIERIDFGDYLEAFDLAERFAEATDATRTVADEYLRAYLDADLDAQRSLLSPEALFQDPTAQVYGPNSGQPLLGAETILERRAGTFQNVTDFDLDVARSFVANHHAVHMGTTKYTLRNGARFEQPAVFVVEVRDGQVTRHWDFVDYSVGPVGA